MSEAEVEGESPTEENLQSARDSTPGRVEDALVPDEGQEVDPAPETPEESLLATPARVEDDLVPDAAVEETAVTPTEESGDEAVSTEGAGPEDADHNPE